MSRIGKKTINIPSGVTVSAAASQLLVKGPKGELAKDLPAGLEVVVDGTQAQVNLTSEDRLSQALWGTYASHLSNMITGVTEGFVKKLVIEGVGYRAETQGNKLVMQLGYSHPVEMSVPEGLQVEVEKNLVSVSGFDKELVGQFAANVRSKRKPEPYKGKGIRYEDEVIRRKEGKKAA